MLPVSRTIADNRGVERPSASEVLLAMVEIFASGDPSNAETVISDEYLDHQGLGKGPINGVSGFAHVVQTNDAVYEQLEVTVLDLFGSGDRAVARIRWQGRRRDGEVVDRETIDILRTADGRAVEHWGCRC